MIASRMRSFLVVVPTPDSAHMIEMFFGDDHELVQALELESLNETFHMGPQIRRQRCIPFHDGTAGFQHLIELTTELRIVVPHDVFGREAHVFGDHQKVSRL